MNPIIDFLIFNFVVLDILIIYYYRKMAIHSISSWDFN